MSTKKKSEKKYGVHSEVGKLHKIMVCAPGKAHNRLTPSSCDELLFDDVLWVERAKRDHFDFMTKMREHGVDVVEMHNLLAETVTLYMILCNCHFSVVTVQAITKLDNKAAHRHASVL